MKGCRFCGRPLADRRCTRCGATLCSEQCFARSCGVLHPEGASTEPLAG